MLKLTRHTLSFDGADSGIISMLEVIESDFTKGTTEMVSAEQTAAATYDKETKIISEGKETQKHTISSLKSARTVPKICK